MKKVLIFIILLSFIHLNAKSEEMMISKNPTEQQNSLNQIFTEQELENYRNHLISKTFPAEDIKNLIIKTTYETIEFSEIYGSEISIDIYSNNNTILPEINLENGKLSITSQIFTKAKKATAGDKCKIMIYLPKDRWLNNLSIVYTPEITAPEKHNVLKIPEIKAHSITIETINTDISGKNLTGSIILKTKNGNITLEKIKPDVKQKNYLDEVQLYVTSQNGSINLSDFTGNYLYLKTEGLINADNVDANFFEIKSTEGNIVLTLQKAPIATSKIITKTGSIQLFIPKTADFTISATSPRGTFMDKIKKQRKTRPNNMTKIYNNGGSIINLETKTGNIELEAF